MKRIRIICLAVLLLFSLVLIGCEKEAAIEGAPASHNRPRGTVQTPYGSYFLESYDTYTGWYPILYRIPADGQKPAPLCSKPGCSHLSSDVEPRDCGAAFNIMVDMDDPKCTVFGNMGFFRDRVYMMDLLADETLVLLSLDPVTGERRQEAVVDPTAAFAEPVTHVSVDYIFHENTLVLIQHATLANPPSDSDSGRIAITLLDLPTMKTSAPFRSYLDACQEEYQFLYYSEPYEIVGHFLYIRERIPEDNDSPNSPGTSRLVRYDLKTGETEVICDANHFIQFHIEGELLYYLNQGSYASDDPEPSASEFVEYNMVTGEKVTIPYPEPPGGFMTFSAYYTPDMIVTEDSYSGIPEDANDPASIYTFFTPDYRKIDDIAVTRDMSLVYIGDSTLYFISAHNPYGQKLFRLNCADIGSGDLRLTPVD